jgi:malonate transporter
LNTFLTHLSLAAPLFVLVLAGYLIARSGRFPASMAEALNRFVFTLALPALAASSPTTCCWVFR